MTRPRLRERGEWDNGDRVVFAVILGIIAGLSVGIFAVLNKIAEQMP